MKILFIQTNYPNFLDEFHKKIGDKNRSYKELKSLWANEYFGSSDFYLKNLKPLGWTGDEIIANDWKIQSAWAHENGLNIKINDSKIFKLVPARIKNLLGLNDKYKKILFKQIQHYKPDVIYIHDVTYFTTEEIKKIKNWAKLVVGQIAYPKPLNQNILKSYDLLISSLPNLVKDFKKMNIKTEYLKWCFEDTILDNIKRSKKIYDVTYVGGLSPHHSKGNKILDKVSREINVNIWGYGRPGIKSAWGRKMYKIFSQSKIIINRHINISGLYANNMRMFEATGMGALLITDSKKNMDEFFKTDSEVVTYKSAEDLIAKIKYYLKNEKERLKIAKSGQKRTLKDHTYKKRMRELDKILKKYI